MWTRLLTPPGAPCAGGCGGDGKVCRGARAAKRRARARRPPQARVHDAALPRALRDECEQVLRPAYGWREVSTAAPYFACRLARGPAPTRTSKTSWSLPPPPLPMSALWRTVSAMFGRLNEATTMAGSRRPRHEMMVSRTRGVAVACVRQKGAQRTCQATAQQHHERSAPGAAVRQRLQTRQTQPASKRAHGHGRDRDPGKVILERCQLQVRGPEVVAPFTDAVRLLAASGCGRSGALCSYPLPTLGIRT